MKGQIFTLRLNPSRAGDRRIIEFLAGLPARQRSARVKHVLLQSIARAEPQHIRLDSQSKERKSSPGSDIAAVMTALTPLEWEMLEEVARHPFLSCGDLMRLLDTRSERAMRRRLASLSQASAVSVKKVSQGKHLYVIGPVGLRILGWHWNESVASLRRRLQIGPRQFGFLQHTVEVNRFFLDLLDAARGAKGHALETWRSEGESRLIIARGARRQALRPDGYGVYRIGEQVYPFLLEWDRGTAVLSKYRQKLALYADYYAGLARSPERDMPVPALWVVTVTDERVEAILATCQSLKHRSGFALPVLVTTTRQLEAKGTLGTIWRTANRAHGCFYDI
jgi:hypothetical protein